MFDASESGMIEHDIGDFEIENVEESWSQFEESLTFDTSTIVYNLNRLIKKN